MLAPNYELAINEDLHDSRDSTLWLVGGYFSPFHLQIYDAILVRIIFKINLTFNLTLTLNLTIITHYIINKNVTNNRFVQIFGRFAKLYIFGKFRTY